MPKTVTITPPSGASVIANQAANFVVTVANTDAAAVTLLSLAIFEASKTGAVIGQPTMQQPGQPAGVNPTLGASSSLSYQFPVVATVPNMPGTSPNNEPGGARPGQAAYPAAAQLVLQAQAQTSDGNAFTSTISVPVLSAVAPFPVPTGGAAQFGQGTGSDVALLAAIL
jgi:hypothetical protein